VLFQIYNITTDYSLINLHIFNKYIIKVTICIIKLFERQGIKNNVY